MRILIYILTTNKYKQFPRKRKDEGAKELKGQVLAKAMYSRNNAGLYCEEPSDFRYFKSAQTKP